MTTTTIGMNEETNTYEIRIPGRDPITFAGTQQQCWERVAKEMVGTESGTIPEIKQVNASKPPGEPAQAAPETHSDAVNGGVSAEGAQRSTLDLLAAQAAGFAPARPYYDRGTPVIDLGVENARKSNREHEAKPRVPEAVAAFVDHIRAENRREEIVPITSLAMRPDGTLTGPENCPVWAVEPAALSQLATKLGIENPGYLGGVWPELRANNWNQWLATAIGHDGSTCPAGHPARLRVEGSQDKTIKARLRDGEDGTPALWAALSEGYAIFDVDSIALALQAGMRAYPEARCEIEYNGTSAKMDVLFHSNVQPERYVAGEFFRSGLRVRTSDSGGGSITISLLVWQNLCLNLLCIDVASFTLDRIRHIGDSAKLACRFQAAVAQGERKLQHFLRAWGYACEEKLVTQTADGFKPEALRLLDEMASETVSETDLLTGIFKGLGKQGKVSIGRDDLPGLLAAHAKDRSGATQVAPVTRASVVNAITRHAHETVGRINPVKQATLESEAGALLIGGRGGNPVALPFLPPTRETVAVR